MLPTQRRQAILAELRQAKAVSAGELARRFGVSLETIRRDLRGLRDRGLLERVYGGALAVRTDEGDFATRSTLHATSKQAIAQLAATLVEPGDTIVIDIGTTALEVARALPEAFRGRVLTNLRMLNQTYEPDRSDWVRDDRAFPDAVDQLEAYFAGQLTTFDLDLAPRGTPFQQRIWRALDSVPYGTTITYGELAAQLGVPPDRVVAVGAAVGANPLLIVRPCHRVVGADGTMRGYAGGVDRKQWLLVHEGVLMPEFA